jgi:hypothetical protein
VSRLEERYRSVLRLLPRSYRALWEEEMVAAFLDSMASDDPEEADFVAEFGRPSWSEVASVALLALRLRLTNPAAPPRYLAWGDAIRIIALVGLLSRAMTGTLDVGIRLWLAGQLPGLPAPPAGWASALPPDVWHRAWGLSGLVGLLAYLALVFGQRRAAQWLAPLALLPLVISTITASLHPAEPLLVTRWAGLLLDALLLAALAGYHRDAPPVHRRPWLLALPAGILLMLGVLFLSNYQPIPLLDWATICCGAVVVAGLVQLAAPLFGRSRTPAWTHALALLALAALVLRLISLADYLVHVSSRQWAGPLTTSLVEVAMVVAVGVPLALLAVRELRRLPDTPAGTPVWSVPTGG